MKIVYCIFFLLTAVKLPGQVIKPVSRYHVKTEDDRTVYLKIKNISFSFDSAQNFYKKGMRIFQCPADSFVTFEILASKFLVVSLYPNNESMSALGPDFRMKNKFFLIDLSYPERKWEHRFYYHHNSQSIKSFNDKTGELLLKDKMKKVPAVN